MYLTKFKVLQHKRTEYLFFNTIRKKYSSIEQIKFSEPELKSLLALSFAIEIHVSSIVKLEEKDRKDFAIEVNPYFKTSIDFGLTLLDSLSDFKKEWLDKLLSKSYKIDNVLLDPYIKEFTSEALIDQMNIRQWEYGKNCLQSFSKIIDETIPNQPLQTNQGQGNFWDIVHQKMTKIKEPIENHEVVLLAFLVKNKIKNSEIDMLDYSIIATIASEKMPFIYKRERVLKQSLSEIIGLNQGLNQNLKNDLDNDIDNNLNNNKRKGKGGPKR